MRRLMIVMCCFAALEVIAQERLVRRPSEWQGYFSSYERRMELLSKSIERDAFLVAEMVHAVADLHDFQKLAAVEKALDRIKKAEQRALENPVAAPPTLTALSQLKDTFEKARTQGTMADPEALQKEILRQTHFIHYELFKELDMARGELKDLAAMIGKVHEIKAGLDSAMIEALGSTFDFVRAGGK